ncbi:MAG: cell wall hydrolase, partial [Gammaproteobacteria bacterium]
VLAALLAGCASAPEPIVATDHSQHVATMRASDAYKVAREDAKKRSRVGVSESRSNAHTSLSKLDAPVSNRSQKNADSKAQQCMAMVMYWEARGEGRKGMFAVGSVVLNRVDDPRFPNSVCDVVYQGGESPPCQFSWWCDGKSDYPSKRESWARANQLANDLLTARPKDLTDGALFFHNTSIENPWNRNLTAQIGNHIFYR